MKSFSNETLNFSSESSVSPTFWVLPKLYELCESYCRNSLVTYSQVHGSRVLKVLLLQSF